MRRAVRVEASRGARARSAAWREQEVPLTSSHRPKTSLEALARSKNVLEDRETLISRLRAAAKGKQRGQSRWPAVVQAGLSRSKGTVPMPRIARAIFNAQLFHVLNRGNDRGSDRGRWLLSLRKRLEPRDVRTPTSPGNTHQVVAEHRRGGAVTVDGWAETGVRCAYGLSSVDHDRAGETRREAVYSRTADHGVRRSGVSRFRHVRERNSQRLSGSHP